MATIQRWGASDWSNRPEQEDEGRDGSCRYRSPAGPQGGAAVSLMIIPVASSGLLMGTGFFQVVGGKMTESGRLCAFITKVKRGSLADTVGHLRPGKHSLCS